MEIIIECEDINKTHHKDLIKFFKIFIKSECMTAEYTFDDNTKCKLKWNN
jgi:hypothetical protein